MSPLCIKAYGLEFDLPVTTLATKAQIRFSERPNTIAQIADIMVHEMMTGLRPMWSDNMPQMLLLMKAPKK